MAITNFDFPAVTLKQVFEESSTVSQSAQSVVCIGPFYALHRAGVAELQALIDQSTTAYNASTGLSQTGLTKLPAAVGTAADFDTTVSTHRVVVMLGVFTYATLTTGITLVSSNEIKFGVPIATGKGYTANAAFGSRGAKVGDPVKVSITQSGSSTAVVTYANIIAINFVTGIGYADIVIDSSLLDTTAGSTIECSFGEYQDRTLTQSDNECTITGTSIVISGNITTTIEGISTLGTLQKGTMYVEYREHLSKYIGQLGVVTSTSDITSNIGAVTPDNPLAAAVWFALKASNGQAVYYTGVASLTSANYETAFDFLEKYDFLYSIVPATEDEAIVKALATKCVLLSEDEESKVRRILWAGSTLYWNPLLHSGSATVPSTNTVKFSDKLFLTNPAQTGDLIKDVTSGLSYSIVSTNSVDMAVVTGASDLPQSSTAAQFQYIRNNPTNANIIQSIIDAKPVSNYRTRLVFADGVIADGEEYSNYAAAAAAAGMASGEECQRPLSNLGYTFFSLLESHGFTKNELKELGANGFWLIASNADGTPINMRQVTSAASNNLNKDEHSIIANVDEICEELSHVGEDMVGNSNISDELIDSLKFSIDLILSSKTSNSTSIYVGPQLLSYTIEDLYQDSVNKDTVYAVIEIEPPKPFNKFNITVRVV